MCHLEPSTMISFAIKMGLAKDDCCGSCKGWERINNSYFVHFFHNEAKFNHLSYECLPYCLVLKHG